MPFLIDGHNLIGQMPDLHLDDPDDELALIRRLRAYCARRRRRAVVLFDHGLPGGRSAALSGGGVEVVFASAGRSADGILRERIRLARDPRGLIVITSDRAIAEAARARGVRVVRAEEFAAELASSSSPPPEPQPRLGEDEVEEWMRLFRKR